MKYIYIVFDNEYREIAICFSSNKKAKKYIEEYPDEEYLINKIPVN